jgi:chromosome segregation ATPase
VDFSSLLSTALSIVAVATLAGLGLLRGTVTTLRENLRDARDEINDKERRLNEALSRLAEAETKIKTQASDLDALARVVTGEAHWVALGQRLEEHHDLAVQIYEEMKKIFADIQKLVEAHNREDEDA